MGSLLNNCPRLNSFLFVVCTIGDYFLQTLRLTSVIKRFVLENGASIDDSNEDREVLSFSAECKSCTSIRHYCGAKKIVFLPSTTIPCCVAGP